MAVGPARPALLRNRSAGHVAGGDGARHFASDRSATCDPGIRDDPGTKRAELPAAYRRLSAPLLRSHRYRQAGAPAACGAGKDRPSALADFTGNIQACRGHCHPRAERIVSRAIAADPDRAGAFGRTDRAGLSRTGWVAALRLAVGFAYPAAHDNSGDLGSHPRCNAYRRMTLSPAFVNG